jgi:methylated-DNA-[protein]-cysteine S-methyltransferase
MQNEYVDYYQSPVGFVKIKASADEVIGVSFTRDMDEPTHQNDITVNTVTQLDEYFTGKRQKFNLPLRLVGTPFQINCLKALLEIPYGTTISYKEQALMIGKEKAVRAVGNSNRVNPIGIIIPCHRVIGSNGKMVGYAGRIDLKEWLIQHEKANRLR